MSRYAGCNRGSLTAKGVGEEKKERLDKQTTTENGRRREDRNERNRTRKKNRYLSGKVFGVQDVLNRVVLNPRSKRRLICDHLGHWHTPYCTVQEPGDASRVLFHSAFLSVDNRAYVALILVRGVERTGINKLRRLMNKEFLDPTDLLCVFVALFRVPAQTLSTSDLRMSVESVGVNARSIFERSDLVQAALDAGIDKLPTGDVVVRESSPRRGVSRRSGGLATVEPLEVNGVVE